MTCAEWSGWVYKGCLSLCSCSSQKTLFPPISKDSAEKYMESLLCPFFLKTPYLVVNEVATPAQKLFRPPHVLVPSAGCKFRTSGEMSPRPLWLPETKLRRNLAMSLVSKRLHNYHAMWRSESLFYRKPDTGRTCCVLCFQNSECSLRMSFRPSSTFSKLPTYQSMFWHCLLRSKHLDTLQMVRLSSFPAADYRLPIIVPKIGKEGSHGHPLSQKATSERFMFPRL
jgi:hypothetical protein